MTAEAGVLHCFLVDCSSSMASARQLAQAKGLLMQLIHMAYKQRAEVAIVGFASTGAQVHLPATLARPLTSQQIEKWLQPLRAGGGTPFAQGVITASGLLTRAARARPAQSRWLWLLTDGRSTESPERPARVDVAVVIDCEQRRVRLNRCIDIARRWGARYQRLADYSLEPPLEKTQ
jgi:magnesium chelatase subunit ChlD-like protein